MKRLPPDEIDKIEADIDSEDVVHHRESCRKLLGHGKAETERADEEVRLRNDDIKKFHKIIASLKTRAEVAEDKVKKLVAALIRATTRLDSKLDRGTLKQAQEALSTAVKNAVKEDK